MCRQRSAFTLTELLVSMAIAITLVAFALPMVKFNLEEGKIREASRQVNAFLAKAKAQAALTGREMGVYIEPGTNNRATNLYLAETPPAFIGSASNSRVIVQSNALQFVLDNGTPDSGSTSILETLLKPDANTNPTTPLFFQIRFDYKGPLFDGVATYSSGFTYTLLAPLPGPPPAQTHRSAYQFYCTPRKIQNSNLELPKGTFLDMSASGVGQTPIDGGTPTILSFGSDGSLRHLFATSSTNASAYNSTIPLGTVHLLVGRVRTENNAPSPLNDPTSLWVSVGTVSGNIRTSDNVANTGNIVNAREFAIKHDVKGR